jgi:hypothetical protein
MLTFDPNMVIFAAGENKKLQTSTASKMQEARSFARTTN